MVCRRCSSGRLQKFNAEMNFHFPVWNGLEKPTVWVFPEVTVCLNCGFADFSIPEGELRELTEGAKKTGC